MRHPLGEIHSQTVKEGTADPGQGLGVFLEIILKAGLGTDHAGDAFFSPHPQGTDEFHVRGLNPECVQPMHREFPYVFQGLGKLEKTIFRAGQSHRAGNRPAGLGFDLERISSLRQS